VNSPRPGWRQSRIARPETWGVRTRLSLVSALVATVGLICAGTVAYLVTSRVLHEQVDDALQAASTQIGSRDPRPVPEFGLDPLCRMLSNADAPSRGQFNVELLRRDGTVCRDASQPGIELSTLATELPDNAGRLPATSNETARLVDGTFENGRAARIAYVPAADGAWLLFARDVESIESVLRTLQLTLMALTVLVAIAALALGRWTTRAGLRPITRFAEVAETIAETGRIDHDNVAATAAERRGTGDELDRLAHAFTTMTAALAEAESQQRRLVADAGHELRTPLSSLRANVDLLRRSRRQARPLDPADEDELLHDLAQQTRELSALVDDLNALAVSPASETQFTTVRLDHVVERATARVRTRARAREFDVRLSPVVVAGNEAEVERAVVNLLDNAVKFSPDHSTVSVTCDNGLVTVSDRGSGLTEKEAQHAFERFWRSSRARSLPGSGLGLSIVKDVAERHGGWAGLRPREGGGTHVSLYVPPLQTSPEDS
jgi:two-component system, OmpR family, sensor histidine kinase MprB